MGSTPIASTNGSRKINVDLLISGCFSLLKCNWLHFRLHFIFESASVVDYGYFWTVLDVLALIFVADILSTSKKAT